MKIFEEDLEKMYIKDFNIERRPSLSDLRVSASTRKRPTIYKGPESSKKLVLRKDDSKESRDDEFFLSNNAFYNFSNDI
jgi:hypothetical protein